jgi:hypothetical protein
VEAFKDWRLTDMRNYGRVLPSSFDTYRAALNTFYTWAAARYDVFNPVPTVGRRGLGLYGLAMGRPVGIRCGAGGIRSDRPGQHGGR